MGMRRIIARDEILQEARNLADGVYAPLRGFPEKEDVLSIMATMRLRTGQLWPMPILFNVARAAASDLAGHEPVVLLDQQGAEQAIITHPSVYALDVKALAQAVFGTTDTAHPGVEKFMSLGPHFVGGSVTLLPAARDWKPHPLYYRPEETRQIFQRNHWRHIVAFQTRNPPHRSHEYLQKDALQHVHGLFIQPVIGPKKSGDVRDEYILGAYELLLRKYYPPGRVLLGTLHTFMRYAGPREALFHALVRRNFGCTHMIIGRDHAGVGTFYDPYEAQNIFDRFSPSELGITILKYKNAAYCKACRGIVFDDVCTHTEPDRLTVSGTHLRESLAQHRAIPDMWMREDIAHYLAQHREHLFVT